MTVRCDWSPDARPMGDAVVAMGVFDGVHMGHKALLGATVAEARRTGSLAIALTFDKDPDHVVRPEAAAPELLTLEDRVSALAATGVDIVLVVPFTDRLASMPAEQFLDDVLGSCCHPVAIHVGAGFRFGAKAQGDIDTLYVWGVEHNAEIRPHDLVVVDGLPVSSTRIRTLITEGDIATATDLLGRAPRIRGSVHHGRGEGVQIGFATANVTPEPHSCLPEDGVYAARALLQDGSVWPTAVSVGVPPTFPEARDYVEAHLIGFEGDLYGAALVLEFIERLRAQQAFGSRESLAEAIAGDIRRTLEIAGDATAGRDDQDLDSGPIPQGDRAYLFGEALVGMLTTSDVLEDGTPVVSDPLALELAEQAVSKSPAPAGCGCGSAGEDEGEWAVVFGPSRLSSLLSDGGSTAAILAGPLADAGIPYAWDPFAPELAQSARPDFNWRREFRLLVPAERAEEAREVLKAYLG